MRTPAGLPDRDSGLRLLFWFTAATAVIVGVTVVVGAVGRMWILLPGIGLHLLMTFLVLHAIVRLMDHS